ncbi:MAG: Rpn family recombination-promoting nuclease/putative transposase [Victivallales bacterium]|nr:Rpn family recombination-promoting nuclease/putative transposase [Victivallales bacterium]
MENQYQEEMASVSNTGCVYDAQLKLLLRDKVYVADICNATVYGGRQVVTADMLEPRPVEQNAVLARGSGGFVTDNRFRDLAFFVRRGPDDEGFLLCLEVQCRQSQEMPLRVLEYNTREIVRFSNEAGYRESHRLPLVVTLVLNFSEGPWKGPRSLLDMAEYRDAELGQVAEQSRLVIVDPFTMDDKMIGRFYTDLKFMLCCWRLSRDDEALQTFLESQRCLAFPSLEMQRTLYMFFNMEFDEAVDNTEGGIGVMCEAIRKIRAKGIEEGKIEGRIEGIKEGIKEGIEKGIEKGKEEGIEQNKHDVAVNALRMKLSIKTIQKLTGLSLENIRSIAQSIAML